MEGCFMSSPHIFELRGEPGRYPGFLQKYLTEEERWKEAIAGRCLALGTQPFGDSYVPVPLVFNNEGKKKNVVGDICLSLYPFIILSEKARLALDSFLSPAGEFLEIAAPVPGFTGFRVLRQINDCVNLELSKYTQYENGAILVSSSLDIHQSQQPLQG